MYFYEYVNIDIYSSIVDLYYFRGEKNGTENI